MTLQERLDETAGRPSGFDYMRIILSVSVVVMHSVITSAGQQADFALWNTPLAPFLRSILPMFFALSGFLVTGSLERCKTLVSFLGLRIIRIYPALAVEVILSAFLIGAMLTSVPLGEYFTSPLFAKYLLNVTGHIHYLLPGVFETNPWPNIVNSQLWTVPFELLCYITLAIATLIGIKRWRIVGPISVVFLILAHGVARLYKHGWQYEAMGGGLPGWILVIAFMAGVSLYLYRDVLPWSGKWAALAAAITLASFWGLPGGEYLGVVTVSYITAYLGLCNPKRLKIIQGADYSYGVYLYGFVIQQTFVAVAPYHPWWLNSIVCVSAAAAFAAMSWHLVEKPALKARKPLMALENRYISLKAKIFPKKPPIADTAL